MKIATLDRAFSLILLLLGLYITYAAWSYGLFRNGVPGPGFFPAIAGVMMAALAAATLLREFTRGGSLEGTIPWRILGVIVASTAAVVAFVLAAEVIGMGIAAIALMIFFGGVAEEDGKRGRRFYLRLVLTAVGTAVGCHLLFSTVIGVPLVKGPLGF